MAVLDLLIEILDEIVRGFLNALPDLLTALLFLAVAYAGIKIALRLLRASLYRVYPEDQRLIADLVVTIVGLILWFGAALALLDIVGMGQIAASLGTATGFLALGVSYALSDMIEDAVAGVYLLRDPDFNPGDRVETGDFTGVVAAIELRKTRFEKDDGDRIIVANRDVEPKWTLKEDGSPVATE